MLFPNTHLQACSLSMLNKAHPTFKTRTIGECFIEEQQALQAPIKAFDGYIEKSIGVSSTCLVQYDTNYYSVPCEYASKSISLKIYANSLQAVVNSQVIAEHKRSFNRHDYIFNPWHYFSILERKPGALRNGAPFKDWPLPPIFEQLKQRYLKQLGGDRDFVSLLSLIKSYGADTVACACELAAEEKTHQLSSIINMLHRLTEAVVADTVPADNYPNIICQPLPNCQRYDTLVGGEK